MEDCALGIGGGLGRDEVESFLSFKHYLTPSRAFQPILNGSLAFWEKSGSFIEESVESGHGF